MIDGIVKILIAAGAAAAAWYADKYVEKKTGKHIHEHVVDYVASLWNRYKNWAQQYLSEHPHARVVYVRSIDIAAAIKRAMNKGERVFKLQVFGLSGNATSGKVILEEDVPLEQGDAVLQKAKQAPVLAMRN